MRWDERGPTEGRRRPGSVDSAGSVPDGATVDLRERHTGPAPAPRLAFELSLLLLGVVAPAVAAGLLARLQDRSPLESLGMVVFATTMAFAFSAVLTRFFEPDEGWALWHRTLSVLAPRSERRPSAERYSAWWSDQRVWVAAPAPFRYVGDLVCCWGSYARARPLDVAALVVAVGAVTFGVEQALNRDLWSATSHSCFLLAGLMVLVGVDRCRNQTSLKPLLPAVGLVAVASVINGLALVPGWAPDDHSVSYLVPWDRAMKVAMVLGGLFVFVGWALVSTSGSRPTKTLGGSALLVSASGFTYVGVLDLVWIVPLFGLPTFRILYVIGLLAAGISALLFAVALIAVAFDSEWLWRTKADRDLSAPPDLAPERPDSPVDQGVTT